MDGARSGIGGNAEAIYAGNRTDAGSGLAINVRNDRSSVVGTGNITDAGSSFGGDVGDDGSAARDDGLATRDDGSAIDNDRLVTGIGKRMDVDNRSDV